MCPRPLPQVFRGRRPRAMRHAARATTAWPVGPSVPALCGWISARSASVAAAAPNSNDSAAEGSYEYALNEKNMSQKLRSMEYAVRGLVPKRAEELEARLRAGEQLPFKHITYAHNGNPQKVGQAPITFFRQVLALCDLPPEHGLDHAMATSLFPKDAIARARRLHAAIGEGGTGAYTHSQGVPALRQDVADFVGERDGFAAEKDHFYLTSGASSAIQMLLTAVVNSEEDAVLIPIPQYPLYSATLALLGAHQAGYQLDEAQGWAVTTEGLRASFDASRARGHKPRACVIINPGNPTGQVFSREALQSVIRFCIEERLVLLADEVYQENVYGTHQFVSARQAALEMGAEAERLELVSFHSTSKGFVGECGRRGGYMQLHNIDPYVESQLFKLASSKLCSGVSGQALTSLMVRPPVRGDESYELYAAEAGAIKEALSAKAQLLVDGLNSIDGFTCNDAQGSMYAYPAVRVPDRAWAAAAERGISVDVLYALSLLETTGVCVVPASGFGQAAGRAGFRTTFLPSAGDLEMAVEQFRRHHEIFCAQYGD
mmetsp:Transcript_2928/g.7697  ORF Transcript_2928/g.7697 Transcript_2928/m.7697 type:complete len:546 (+) Transcript_2928:17-1654(+)